MNARLVAIWDDLLSSYWFIPSLMTVGAVVLSFVTTKVDGVVGSGWIDSVSWLYANKPDGARTLLATIASSMIGVAGVTFSITIVAVVYASGQYGPRLLTNFMRDQGNQITLGTFIATFLYSLLVLRTIRAADEGYGGENPAGDLVGPFVPHIAIVTALVFALASIAVLIFFIHHIPESIHVSNVTAGIGNELHHKIDTLFPERIGTGGSADEEVGHAGERPALPDDFFGNAEAIKANSSGYLQGIDASALLHLATDHDLLLRVRHRPGDFVSDGDTLVHAWPSSNIEDETGERLRTAFAWGRQRTARQDVRFLINELVEIAARALSPGVNDPFTAMGCMDWLGAALKRLADRDIPSADRYDEHGTLRVVAEPTTYEEFVSHVFAQLRPYVAADRNATLHALKLIAEVGARVETQERRDALRHQADALLDGAETILALDADRASVRQRHGDVVRLLSGRVSFEDLSAETDWIGGTA